jgi:hypothetical protein
VNTARKCASSFPIVITVEDQTTNALASVDNAAALFERIRGYAESIEVSRGIIQEARQRCESQQ